MIIAFFGCWRKAGHFLWFPGWQQKRDFEIDNLNFPREHVLDASILFLPRPEQAGIGMRTYLPAPNKTIFAWWGSPWDSRPGVNSALIVEGNRTLDEAWEQFNLSFPQSELIQKPIIIRS
jgi:hypothetical protein